MLRRLRGFFNLLANLGERAELQATIDDLQFQNTTLKSQVEFWQAEHRSITKERDIALVQIEVDKVSIDGMAAVVEQYRQEQLAQARTFAMKAQPARYDDNS